MSTAIASYHDHAAWMAARRRGLGGSDIAALFGLHPYKTAHQVWLEKMGRAPEQAETPDMRRGKRQEPLAADVYVERTGRKVRRWPLRQHSDFPHLIASIDRQIIAGRDRTGTPVDTGALELKVPRQWNYYRIKREGLPPYIILQGQHEALVWGYDYTAFGIFNPDDDAILTFDVAFDADVSDRIIEVAGDWWHTHIERGKEPDQNAAVPSVEKLPEVAGELVYRSDEQWRAAAQDYFEARELVKSAEAIKDEAADRIKQLAGGIGIYEDRDVSRFYYSQRDGRKSFDQKALAAATPIDAIKLWEVLVGRGFSPDDIHQVARTCTLELDQFYKVGAGYTELRGYLLRAMED